MGLGGGLGAVASGSHPLSPTVAPRLNIISRTVPMARLRFPLGCMAVKVAALENVRRSYPQIDGLGRVLGSIVA
ncbi:hypothetical protein GCM10027427_16220 [Pseudoclavibacter terrae]